MVVCKFWQRGSCRNGDSCRFEHPGASRQSTRFDNGYNGNNSGNNSSRRNPFDALRDEPQQRQPRSVDSYRPGTTQDASRAADDRGAPRFFLDEGNIRTDLTAERPLWPASNYCGAGENHTQVPKHLFDSAMEQSPEEVRCQYYLAKLQGHEAQAQQAEAALHQASMAEVNRVQSDIRLAMRAVIDAKRQHPNRWDIMNEVNQNWPTSQVFRASQSSNLMSNGPSNPFGSSQQQSGFGRAAQPAQNSTFGQPSSVGQTSVFGQQRQPGQSSAFGQSSQLGVQGGFGQASQPSQNTNPFGGGGSSGIGFGQPSQMGQNITPLGQSSAPVQASAFDQPSALGSSVVSGFGQSFSGAAGGFGQTSTPGSLPNPFGQPVQGSPFGSAGQGTNQASSFGQPTQTTQSAPPTNSFGQPTQATQTNTFGQPAQNTNAFGSAFGQGQQQGSTSGFGQALQNSTQANGFGVTTQPQPSSNAFAQKSQPQQSSTGNFGQSSQPNPFGQPAANAFGNVDQKRNAFLAQQPGSSLAAPSLQINTTAARVVNAAVHANAKSANPHDADPPMEMYAEKAGLFKDAYLYVLQNDAFEGDVMPEIAPQHDWVGYGPMERNFV